MSRRKARFIAFQSLFELDFQSLKDNKLEKGYILEKNIAEFKGEDQAEFVTELFNGVTKNLEIIDSMIEKAAPEWPIAQINLVDRNVLRLGIYELVFGNSNTVPPKVAINESIEVAKAFGSDSSGRFINGVLGTIYRELKKTEEGNKAKDEKPE